MDEEIFKSTSQEVGLFRDFQGSDAMDSGQRRLVDSTQSVPVVQFVSDELSEVFGNQGSGAWPQNDNMNRGARTALVDHLSSNLALISEYQCGTYFPQSPFDGERGEQENILPEPIPLHLVSDFGRQTSCLFQELIGRQNLFPLERLCNLPKAISLPENFQKVGGRSVAPNTVADIYPMEIGDIGPQQQQNGFSLSSLFGCTRYQGETGEILHLVSASEPQMIETRAETYLDERDQAKRSKSILLCNFANERVCKDNPISPQSLPSNPEVSSNQLHSDGLKANTQGAVPPNQPSEQRGRACRGQATDPHSISERIRRVKISERLGTLQSLVPDSNKTDKASILDEIIDYVKLLQLQVFTMSKIRCHGVGANASFITKFKPETLWELGLTLHILRSNISPDGTIKLFCIIDNKEDAAK